MASSTIQASAERTAELGTSLSEIRSKVTLAATPGLQPLLIAVSKYKPSSDIAACFDHGQRDFGENYVQELVDKAKELPQDIRWHFIGTLQSNKAKTLAAIPNLYAIQTLTSIKAADALNRNLPETRPDPLRVLLQVNTSGEEAKSGLSPLIDDAENVIGGSGEGVSTDSTTPQAPNELLDLAKHILLKCPRLHLWGLMTIGSLTESLSSDARPNRDFEHLVQTRDRLSQLLSEETDIASLHNGSNGQKWGGEDGKLVLSMGMSSDFEAALRAGSDIVRVGTGIFGARHTKSG